MIEDSDRVVRFMKKRKEAVVGFNLEVNAMERRNAGYRVRARDARIRVMRRTLLIATCKNKAAQQRIIAIIIKKFSRVFYRYRQLTYLTGSRINRHADHFCQDYTTTPLLQQCLASNTS